MSGSNVPKVAKLFGLPIGWLPQVIDVRSVVTQHRECNFLVEFKPVRWAI